MTKKALCLLAIFLLTIPPIITAAPVTHYVWTNSPSPGSPFDTWDTAATNIQDAVNVAASGDTVLVTNGVYDAGGMVTPGYVLMNRVCVTNAITVLSVNGPENTVIVGGGSQGASAIRCGYLAANAVLSGFTLTNGHTRTDGDGNFYYDASGGGAFLSNGGTLSNCAMAGCTAGGFGGGACAYGAGGAIDNCIFTGNSAYYGGGACYANNPGGSMNSCLFTGNSTPNDAGAFYSTVGGALYNCTIYSNTAGNAGGAAFFDSGGTVENCIVIGNAPDNMAGNYTASYTCSPGLGGTGNIAADPRFVNAAAGNYRLSATSPCINAGLNEAWMSDATDLDGNPRVVGTVVDMGAYEFHKAVAPAAGDGSPASPYQISEFGNLVWMAETVGSSSGKYYTVQNDIDASDTTNSTYDSGAGFAPIGNTSTNFMGIFNGNGKVISNLTINRSGQDYVGLFGYVGSGGIVKDLGLAGGAVTGHDYVGGVVGYNADGPVSRCHVTGPVTGNFFVGGLVGFNQYGIVSGCYATGTVTGLSQTGGLVGSTPYGTVYGCYATCSVTGSNYVGGLVGANEHNPGAVSNCYATGTVNGSGDYVGGLMGLNYGIVRECYATGPVNGSGNRVGGLVGYTSGGLLIDCYAAGPVAGGTSVGGLVGSGGTGGIVTNCYWDTNTTGQAVSHGGIGMDTAELKTQATFTEWDFTNAWRIAEGATYPFFGVAAVTPAGDGSLATPYQITELGNLVWMGDTVSSSSGMYYTMQNDIDASATLIWDNGAGFAPIGTVTTPFMGIFDGNGKVISNLNIQRPSQDYVGLFGFLDASGVVKNLGLARGAVTGSNYVGGLVGKDHGGTVSGCYATGTVNGNGAYVAGLVGFDDGTVSNCYATGAVTGNSYVGGLVGYNGGTLRDCYAMGSVTGGDTVGGLVGASSGGSVSNCYATGAVTGSSSVGGFSGYNNSPVTSSYWDTNSTGQATSSAGTGTNTAAMMQQATFVGWDFTNVWRITDGVTYPLFVLPAATLSIATEHGTATPLPGVYTNFSGTVLTNSVTSPDQQGTTQYVCAGWIMSGNDPLTGSTTNCVMTLTNNAALTWQWQTNYMLAATASSNGSVNATSAWYQPGNTGSVTATASNGYYFSYWTGTGITASNYTANPLTLLMDQPYAVTAYFSPLPDFVVTNIVLTPAVPAAGFSFSASVTVYNRGGAGNAGYLYVYTNKTTNVSVKTKGTKLLKIGTLGSGSNKTVNITGLSAGTQGLKTFRAFIDATGLTPESVETNNQKTLPYTVTNKPDLIVSSITLDPIVPSTGYVFNAAVVIKNQGHGVASNFHVSVWENMAAAPANSNLESQGADIAGLGVGQVVTNVFFGLDAGTGKVARTLRVFVDSTNGVDEELESNNQLTKAYTPVGHAEFWVTGITLTPTNPVQGKTFTASVTVTNTGSISASAGSLYVWTDKPGVVALKTPADKSVSVGTMTANQGKTLTITGLTAGTGGTKTFRAFIDATGVTTEMIETNNQTTLSYNVITMADLTISGVTLTPSVPARGGVFTAAVTVTNIGSATATGVYISVWADMAAVPLNNAGADDESMVGNIGVNQSYVYTTTLDAGTGIVSRTFRAFADSTLVVPEWSEADNQKTVVYKPVSRPDFMITGITLSSTNPPVGSTSFWAQVTVTNIGYVAGTGGYMDVWANMATNVVANKTNRGDRAASVGVLATNAGKTLLFTGLSVGTNTVPRTFRALVDSRALTQETSETNNEGTATYTPGP